MLDARRPRGRMRRVVKEIRNADPGGRMAENNKPARRRLRRRSGGSDMLIFLALLAIIGGAAFALRDRLLVPSLKNSGNGPVSFDGSNKAGEAPERKNPIKKPLGSEKSAASLPAPNVEAPVPSASRTAVSIDPAAVADPLKTPAGAAYAEGERLFKELRMDEAEAAYKKATGLDGPEVLKRNAANMATNMSIFRELTKDVKPLPDAIEKEFYIFKTRRDEIRGVVVGETADAYQVKTGNMKFDLPKSDVVSKQPVTLSERREGYLREYEKQRAAAAPEGGGGLTGLACWELSEYCMAHDLSEKTAELFMEALKYDKDIYATVRNDKAEKIFQLAHWYNFRRIKPMAKQFYTEVVDKYPGTVRANDARECLSQMDQMAGAGQSASYEVKRTTGTDEKETFVVIPVQSKASVAVAPGGTGVENTPAGGGSIVEQANQAYQKALDELVVGRPGMPNYVNHLHECTKYLKEARDLYRKVSASDPKNQALLDRITEVNNLIFGVGKMTPLSIR